MMKMMMILLLFLPGILTQDNGAVPFNLTVQNSVDHREPQTYDTYVVYRGILLGAMRRLKDSSADFTFTYTEDPNYGPFLESVNGIAGCNEDQTYWELLIKKPDNSIIRPDVGIGCYIPSANEEIIFNFRKW